MKTVMKMILALVLVTSFSAGLVAGEKKAQYIGAKKCKMCHNSKKSGAQFKVWQASKHANAFATLASEEAKAIGKKMGISDPQKSEKCLKCHSTGYGEDATMFSAKFSPDEGVGCESCHGPGSLYKSMKVMKGISSGKMSAADYGLVKADEARCKACHNEESPTFKAFDFKTFWAKIAHPVPSAK